MPSAGENSILKNLNPQQIKAVKHTEGPLLILAGAGSGKTRVLTHRIAYLIRCREVSPENILAITFTNKAAGEMKERLTKLIGFVTDRMWVSTFHSACARILRNNIDLLGYKRNFAIYDAADQRNLLKEVLNMLNLDEKRFPIRGVQETISRAKNQLYTPEMFGREGSSFYDAKVAEIYSLYQQKLRENNALDFDDLLMQTVFLLSGSAGVLDYYRRKFQYILVDEYQDTNYAQYVLIKLLSETHRNICVVGDDDQSIYGWRGADIRNILNFEDDFPEARIIKLEQNYRSTKNILRAANEVVRNNRGRKEKTLWTDNTEGDKVIIYLAPDEKSEARFLAREIQQLQEEGKKLGDVAVLYRTNAQSRVIEECFMREGIPYNIVGTLKFYERREIRDIIAYLKILANPEDGLSMARIINVPRRGIGEVTWGKIQGYARERGISIFQAALEAEKIPGLGRAERAVAEFGQLLKDLKEEKNTVTVTKLTLDILNGTGYLEQLEQEKTEESYTRLENIREFLSVTQEYDRSDVNGSLEDFLEKISLISDADVYSETPDSVIMMTLHTAKGLEFPVVFITGLEEGIFPHSRSLTSEPEIEEERRLCYVGMTRAKEKLYLTHARQRSIYGNTFYSEPSRFIREIPEDMVEILTPENTGDDVDRDTENGIAGVFSVGDKVYHEKWGAGRVVEVEGFTERDIISVAFDGKGIKRLIPQYAPLKKF